MEKKKRELSIVPRFCNTLKTVQTKSSLKFHQKKSESPEFTNCEAKNKNRFVKHSSFFKPVLRSPLLWGLRLQPRGTIDRYRQPLREHPDSNKSCVAISESFWILEATIKNRHFRGWKTTLPWQQIMMLGLFYHWPKRKLMAWGCAKSLFQVNVPSTNTNDVDPLDLEIFATWVAKQHVCSHVLYLYTDTT